MKRSLSNTAPTEQQLIRRKRLFLHDGSFSSSSADLDNYCGHDEEYPADVEDAINSNQIDEAEEEQQQQQQDVILNFQSSFVEGFASIVSYFVHIHCIVSDQSDTQMNSRLFVYVRICIYRNAPKYLLLRMCQTVNCLRYT